MPKDRFDHRNMGFTNEYASAIPGRPKYSPEARMLFAAQQRRDAHLRVPSETVSKVARLWYLGDTHLTPKMIADQLSISKSCVTGMVTGQTYKHKWLDAVAEIINEGHQCVQPRVRERAEKASRVRPGQP